MSSAPSDPLPTPSEPDNPAPLPSTVVEVRKIAGLRYQVLRPHDKGGIGEVFVALDQELNREVALKEMQERHAADAHIMRPLRPRGRDHRRIGASGHRAGLWPWPIRRRPALLRHALHPGRNAQGRHYPLSPIR